MFLNFFHNLSVFGMGLVMVGSHLLLFSLERLVFVFLNIFL